MDVLLAAKKVMFQVWRTAKIGTGLQAPGDFRKAMKQSGFQISDWANSILDKVMGANKEEEVELVKITNAELGFPEGARVEDTYRRAKELSLKLCPQEVGLQLRLQYTDQPMGEWLLIGMEPIRASDGYPRVFYVVRNEPGTWLSAAYGYPEYFWYGNTTWLFRK